MKNYFVSNGINEERVVELEMFDYLCENGSFNNADVNDRTVIYAGNLSSEKSPFLSHLSEIAGVNFRLYGVNYDESMIAGNNIAYQGAFSAEVMPNLIGNGYGLVWDGESVSSCTGSTGEYLLYNNPHKLSLYLAAGLPIIVWKHAAVADIVRRYKCGVLIESLHELKDVIDDVTEAEYKMYVRNARKIAENLRKGYYTKRALAEAKRRLADASPSNWRPL